MLTLLALMLAFTYSFSMSRADLRKRAIITEVNALGTAFVRADRLSEPGRTEVRQRLYDYTESRMSPRFHFNPGRDGAGSRSLGEETIENLASRQVSPATTRDMTDPEMALLVSAVNDVLDSHTSRMAVIYDRLPTAVLALLVLIAGTALGLAAYNSSLSGHPIRWRMTAFAFILASLIYLILDYDMMMRGFIQVDHSSLVVLIDEMNNALKH